jgi:hypothetical protein
VWDSVTLTSGSSATFRVFGYAAFRVTAFNTSPPSLTGHFTLAPRQIDATTPPDPDAPDLGARAVYLTKD